MREHGVLKGDSKFYVSLAHTEADVRHTLDAFAAAVAAEKRLQKIPHRKRPPAASCAARIQASAAAASTQGLQGLTAPCPPEALPSITATALRHTRAMRG